MSKYGHRSHNWFDAVINKLGGEDRAEMFLRDELVISAVPKFFPTFCSLKLGTGITNADGFRKALQSAGCKIGNCGNDILGKPTFTTSPVPITLELCVASAAELGFKNGAKFSAVCSRIKELGYDLCPNEVGPQLRLQYKDQPKGEWLAIAMEPITDSGGLLLVFRVVHDGGELWLNGSHGIPDHFWRGSTRFVFVRRKVSA